MQGPRTLPIGSLKQEALYHHTLYVLNSINYRLKNVETESNLDLIASNFTSIYSIYREKKI